MKLNPFLPLTKPVITWAPPVRKPLLPLNLQFFADDNDSDNQDNQDDDQDNQDNGSDQGSSNKDKGQKAKTYTQDELEEIIKQRLAREKKAAEKAIKEAEKLAKMNEDQKKQYELEKLQGELEEYKKKEAFYGLSKEATKMLSEKGITANDDVLAFVVKETAEDTQDAVKAFVDLINAKVEEGVKKALSGKSPKVNPNPGLKNPFSKEHFNLTEQGRLKREDPERYKTLKALAGK
ncbi:DUF4355 domain-containing protein [Bacillus marasmi]|uniref:DUF4355 domain-containing protein n=1 Tax=Bacillus marasmi TaxID=1926279 RepID=UPI0011C8A4EB|nr:DUF4355 domain-containing protein [Bacillus marasmi]